MTAPDLVEVVAGVLEDHQFSMFAADGYCVCTCEATIKGTGEDWNEFAAHQARAVLDALTEAGTVEWGVRWGGVPSGVLAFDSEEDAREAVELGGLLFQLTLPWTAVE